MNGFALSKDMANPFDVGLVVDGTDRITFNQFLKKHAEHRDRSILINSILENLMYEPEHDISEEEAG
jgi:hypothetical protein